MNLLPSDKTLLRRIKTEEGFRHQPYRDTRGILTIGWGSNMHHLPADQLSKVWSLPNRTDGLGITEDQAQVFLLADVRATIAFLERYSWWAECTRTRQLALTDMAYQLGEARFRQFRRMLAAIRRGDWQRAADEALDSRWATQTPARAQRVAEALRWSGRA